MEISKEKEHIYTLMRDITEERRKLTEMYYDLKMRLDELNKLEKKELLSDIPLEGYVQLFNDQRRIEEVAGKKVVPDKKEVERKVEEPKSVIPKKDIEKAKDEENVKRNTNLNVDKVIGTISHVLKESSVMISTRDLHEKVQKTLGVSIGFHNFRNNILPKARRKNSRIVQSVRGHYEYKTE
ncbi:hypothetical protein [Bacillus mojavensis]